MYVKTARALFSPPPISLPLLPWLWRPFPDTHTADASRRRLLHFAVVGGGPTGIEYAAELHDLIHDDLSRIYPSLMPFVGITVYDIAPKILPMFDQALASYAMGLFRRQNIHVKTGHSIQRIRPDAATGGLRLKIKEHGDEEVGAGIVVWSTGLMQNPLVEKLVRKTVASPPDPRPFRLDKDRKTGGIVVDDRFRAQLTSSPSPRPDGADAGPPAQLLPDVFVIGDCAVISSQPTLPKTAQVASQQAAYLAKALNKIDKTPLDAARPFAFRNLGTMTYLGNWKAIHQSSADHLTGWAAWVLWRTAYLTRSMSLRNKMLVPVYVSRETAFHPLFSHSPPPTIPPTPMHRLGVVVLGRTSLLTAIFPVVCILDVWARHLAVLKHVERV